jgi:hypothetical protein
MMRTAYRIVSMGLLVALLGLLGLVLASPLYIPAPAPPPQQTACKVWNVQLGPILFAIPYTAKSLDGPLVDLEGKPSPTPWMHDLVRCDDVPAKIRRLDFVFIGKETMNEFVMRGALPLKLRMSHPPKPPNDVNVNSGWFKVDPSLVKTRCREGFDTGINQKPSLLPIFGCRKDSGRLLVWICAFSGISHDHCHVSDNYGPVTISYEWARGRLSHEKAAQLDDSIIDYLNHMVAGGEKLPQ